MLEADAIRAAYEATVDQMKRMKDEGVDVRECFPEWLDKPAVVQVVNEDTFEALTALETTAHTQGRVGVTTAQDIAGSLASQFHWGMMFGFELARYAVAAEEDL